jgi:RHH-type transcriptional regulator, proline utilization regulon repressor / proline dehydrogenase / delta 1-pyrroline-5-carboxylate dehydrogenase
LDTAVSAQPSWGNTPIPTRKKILVRCAEELAQRRGDFLGIMALDGGKAIPEADPEISEAIDFANYYARSLDLLRTELSDIEAQPLGTVLITPPWNFPVAIPAGGILAALMAGNSVILKPAPEAVLCGWHIVQAFWEAGVPQEVLQFVPTTDDDIGRGLVTDARINAVILTGAYATGRMFQNWKPDLNLLAETSGKNSMIITAMADHDQAIKELVKSAFGHNGQKCSAASLAVLEAEVYDNPSFMKQLKDATASLHVGSAWDSYNKVTPLIREPGAELRRAQTTLEPGESWLLEPRMVDGNPNLWSPGIKLGVQRGSFYHQTECFGPVLGLMRAKDLAEAIAMVNDSAFGLTSGLQSLDEREVAIWQEQIEVGNAYINRGTTGAIVQRQPFGGWKKSVFGSGAKAGGPNYVLSLMRLTAKGQGGDLPTAVVTPAVDELLQACQALVGVELTAAMGETLNQTAGRYAHAWQSHYGVAHDPSQVLGESNVFRYRPLKGGMVVRVAHPDDVLPALQALLAARTCNTAVYLSVAPGISTMHQLAGLPKLTIATEDEAQLARSVGQGERLILFGAVDTAVRQAANEAHVPIIDVPLTSNGRVALRYFLREQAVSYTTHPYGNIMA